MDPEDEEIWNIQGSSGLITEVGKKKESKKNRMKRKLKRATKGKGRGGEDG
jgi:hypothetical protein